jgi:hypothetical protein
VIDCSYRLFFVVEFILCDTDMFLANRLNVPNILDYPNPLLPLQAPKSLSVGPLSTDNAEVTCSDINNELLDFTHLVATSNQQIVPISNILALYPTMSNMALKLPTRHPTSLYMPMKFSMVAKTAKSKIA